MTYFTIRNPSGSITCGSPERRHCEKHREIEIEDAQWSITYEREALPRSLEWCNSHRLRARHIRWHRERMAKAKARLRYWQAAEIQERHNENV